VGNRRAMILPTVTALALAFLTGCVTPQPSAESTTPASPSTTVRVSAPRWAMMGHDAQRTAASPNTGPAQPRKLWSGRMGDHIESSPAVGPDGTIYAGGGDEPKLYAFGPNGVLKWIYATDGAVLSSPAVADDGTVYVETLVTWGGDTPGSSGSLYALNRDGSLKWRRVIGQWVQSSPVITAGGTIYVCSSDGKLHALTPDGVQVWEFAGNGSIWTMSPAVAPDGTIYFGTDRDHNAAGSLYAIRPDGTKKWEFVTESAVAYSPAVAADGTVYIFANQEGKLLAIDPEGQRRWEFAAGSAVSGSPGLGPDGSIYFASDGGKVFALRPDGSKLWSLDVGDGIECVPAVDSEGTIYLTGDRLRAVDHDGKLKWTLGEGPSYRGSVAIGPNGTLYAVEEHWSAENPQPATLIAVGE
jgi:outer membrane protein assembly factor BamB